MNLPARLRLRGPLRGSVKLRLNAWAHHLAHRLGPLGLVGVCLVVLTAAVLVWAQLARAQTDALAQQAEQLRTVLARPAAAPQTAVAGVEAFMAALPGDGAAPLFIETLHREAARAQVQIERAEYRVPTLAGGKLRRTEVVLPVQGTYADVARWLSAVLYEHPSAALDQLSLQREASGALRLNARVVLSHYSRVSR
jgi:hypothetical protein